MRFSDVFSQELKTKSQKDFDFVNIRLDTDIPLYIDASRIELQTDSFFKNAMKL